MICMWITCLVILRQPPETSTGISIVRKKRHPRYSTPEKEEWKGCCSAGSRKGKGIQWSVYVNKNEHTQVPLLDRSAPFINDIVVSKDGVIKLLKGLNPSKALGTDELHPRVLKEIATELGPVFAHLFQQSIDTGEIQKD